MPERSVILGITGASGAPYAVRLCRELLAAGVGVILTITDAGAYVLKREAGVEWSGEEECVNRRVREYFEVEGEALTYHDIRDVTAAVASGSAAADAMVVCPCTMGTLARIACGNSGNLLERAADVMLKERRTLILVPRETPLSQIHLENMLRLACSGAVILPAMPAFYHAPSSIDDLVAFMVGKVLDALRVENTLFRRWREGESSC